MKQRIWFSVILIQLVTVSCRAMSLSADLTKLKKTLVSFKSELNALSNNLTKLQGKLTSSKAEKKEAFHILELAAQNFDKEVLESERPVIVDFYAPWCGPCKAMAPLFYAVAAELNSKYKFAKFNIDNGISIAKRYQVSSIPAILFFKYKKVVARHVGVMNKQTLESKIKECFE